MSDNEEVKLVVRLVRLVRLTTSSTDDAGGKGTDTIPWKNGSSILGTQWAPDGSAIGLLIAETAPAPTKKKAVN